MQRVKAKNTKPELAVRRLLHGLGFRFRLHDAKLPGCPDIVLKRYRTIVFVHGCFWHRHKGCPRATVPETNKVYWENKFARNIERDKSNAAKLRKLGWRVIVVWECELKRPSSLTKRLTGYLCT